MKKSSTTVIIIVAVAGIAVLALLIAGGLFLRTKFTNIAKVANIANNAAENERNNTPGNYSSLNDACEYFTAADAEEILGQKATASDESNDKTSCFYTTDITTGKFGIAAFIIANVSSNKNADAFNLAKSMAYDNKVVDVKVSGADNAYWVEKANQLNILKGNNWFIFSVIAGDTATYKDLTTKQAEMVMKRIN
jgi:hypothetical protein